MCRFEEFCHLSLMEGIYYYDLHIYIFYVLLVTKSMSTEKLRKVVMQLYDIVFRSLLKFMGRLNNS